VLVKQIPLHGAFGRAVEAIQAQTWQQSEELLALIAELIDTNNRLLFMVNSKKGTPPPKALKIERPHQKPKKRRAATNEELIEMFGATRVTSDQGAE
jgi:hypothetical protein